MNNIKAKLLNQIDAQLQIERKYRTMTKSNTSIQGPNVLDYAKVLLLFRDLVENTSEWNVVDEKSPSENGSYLVQTKIVDDTFQTFFCDYSQEDGWVTEDNIIAWQEIDPYEEKLCLTRLETIEQLKSLLSGGKNELTGEEFDSEKSAFEKDLTAVECALEYLKGDICYE